MKRFLIGMLAAVMMLTCCATAELDRIDDRLFDRAKQTMHCLDVGDYQTAGTILSFTDGNALMQLAQEQFTTLGSGMAQTRVSVAYVTNGHWYLAVPTQNPAFGVETLLLDCGSGSAFSGVSEIEWSMVEGALDGASMVIWNEEASSDVIVIAN